MKLVATLALALLPIASHAQDTTNTPLFNRVILVVLENTNYQEALQQPFMKSLAGSGALLTNFEAEDHPSQPNYIAMISGSTLGVSDDSSVDLGGRHLGDLLEDKGLDWRTYAEDFPGNCFLGSKRGNYARKHVPFLSFTNVQNNAKRCAKIVNATQFDADLKANRLPEFSLYVPNLKNDGHDTSPAYADRWLSGKFGALLADANTMKNTLFVVTFDENDDAMGGGPNQVYTAMVGPMVRAGASSGDHLNHYSVLRLMEDNWGLDHLTRGDGDAAAITGIWNNNP
jgi:hypothetical protein